MDDVTVPRKFLERVLDCIANHCMQRTYASGVMISNVAIELRQALLLPPQAAKAEPKPVAWRWVRENGEPDSGNCFPMPGPNYEAISNAASLEVPGKPQFLWSGPPPKLEEVEDYRMQMAAISTAALGYHKEGDPIHPAYVTPALLEVMRLYEAFAVRSDALRSVLGWMEGQADGQSKGGHATFDLAQLREQRDIARDALAVGVAR